MTDYHRLEALDDAEKGVGIMFMLCLSCIFGSGALLLIIGLCISNTGLIVCGSIIAGGTCICGYCTYFQITSAETCPCTQW